MSLHATTLEIEAVEKAFPTAQDVRELLLRHGFVPMCRIEHGEHFCRRGRRVILLYKGDIPGAVPADSLMYATLVWQGPHTDPSSYHLSLD